MKSIDIILSALTTGNIEVSHHKKTGKKLKYILLSKRNKSTRNLYCVYAFIRAGNTLKHKAWALL